MPCPSSRASVPTAQNAASGSARPTQSTNADGRRPHRPGRGGAGGGRRAGRLRAPARRRPPRRLACGVAASIAEVSEISGVRLCAELSALVFTPKTNRPAGRATPDDLSGFHEAMADYGRDVSDPDRLALDEQARGVQPVRLTGRRPQNETPTTMSKLAAALITTVITTVAIVPAVADAGVESEPSAATTPYRPYDGM